MTLALDIQGLKKTYGKDMHALKGIDFQVKAGDFYALLGPNGAGKSTAIGILTSIVAKTEGKVHIFGYDIDTHFSQAKQCLGVVPQEFNFNQFEKVLHVVLNQAGYYGLSKSVAIDRAEKYLRKLDLWDKRDTAARNLSGGMKRRLMIARALIHEPKLLVLDEPTAGVDIELRRSMWEFLKEENAAGTTIILTTHYLEEAESLCRNIGIINKGEMVANTSMRALLAELNKETLVFDSDKELPADFLLEGFEVRMRDAHSFEVDIDKSQSINDLFRKLEALQIEVSSMRNKANRLEEMFVNMLSNTSTT
jgi:ABC-2 type transport system ATP-binding protein